MGVPENALRTKLRYLVDLSINGTPEFRKPAVTDRQKSLRHILSLGVSIPQCELIKFMNGGYKTRLASKELPAFPVLAQQSPETPPERNPTLLRLVRAKKPVTNLYLKHGRWYAYLP